MVIVRLMGGLGNQMFQYAAALRLADKHRTEVKFDLTFLRDRTPRPNFVYRQYDLDLFRVACAETTRAELRRIQESDARPASSLLDRARDSLRPFRVYHEEHPGFCPAVLDLPRRTYLNGYFQDERYFIDIASAVRNQFEFAIDEATLSPETRRLAEQIRTKRNAICLNIRRADYVTNPVAREFHGVCGLAYFERAVRLLDDHVLRGRVFVFSDDVDWCRENVGHWPGTTVVQHEHAGERFSTYFWLMTLCQHFIIPNSTFAWWAAWLASSPQKVVVRPAHWFRAPELHDIDICPASWLKVENE
jgi:hypothetical protein